MIGSPVVSVCITTYNNSAFIAQALESVLSQQTDFPFEVIVGEDDSTDGTRQIVKEYAAKYPCLIRPFFNSRKNVIRVDGRATGRWNFMNNLQRARGEFIALLDGDDYWTDPCKLQLQTDALRNNADCTFCFHNAELLDNETQRITGTYHDVMKTRVTIEDVASGFFIPTCSTFFRAEAVATLPEWFVTTPVADWPLHVLNASQGDGIYINRIMATHRIHRGGVWSGEARKYKHTSMIRCANILDAHFDHQYRSAFNEMKFAVANELGRACFYSGDPIGFLGAALGTLRWRGTRSFWSTLGSLKYSVTDLPKLFLWKFRSTK